MRLSKRLHCAFSSEGLAEPAVDVSACGSTGSCWMQSSRVWPYRPFSCRGFDSKRIASLTRHKRALFGASGNHYLLILGFARIVLVGESLATCYRVGQLGWWSGGPACTGRAVVAGLSSEVRSMSMSINAGWLGFACVYDVQCVVPSPSTTCIVAAIDQDCKDGNEDGGRPCS